MAINVSDNNPRINYTATSGQTVFTVPFEFFASTDLTVYVGGSVLATSAYTVTGGSGSTGSITTSSGQTAGAEIAIVRDVPLERTTDLTASYSASSLNDQLDRLVTQVADLDDRVSRSISLNDYEVGVSLDLPAKASRLGKTIQFHSTTGALEVGPSGDELTSIASIASDITSLNGIKTNVTTVAGAISNVNSVGSNISSVTSVASSISNVNTVNTNIANVNSLAGSISDINDVADSLDQVELVGGSISNVDVVGAAISNVNTVAGGISNINTVAGISGNVTTVAGITSAISTVNSNATNINLVATNIDDVNDVANVITKVTTVADNIANVNTVAPSVGYLSTIANNIANINTLAPISADITTVAGVASSVSSAAANAAAAEAAKIAAQAAQAAAELAADNFDDTYLGAKASDPTLDNDGDSLGDGDLYFNTTNNILKVYSDSAWQAAALDASGLVNVTGSTMTGNLLFGDGNEARFGTHGDLTIEHDLNNSNIIAANNKPLNITANGGFNINSDNIYFREHAASNTYMEMRDGGGYDHAVRIFHSGTDVRLETTSTGVDVTGTLTSDGLTVDGTGVVGTFSSSNNNTVLRVKGNGATNGGAIGSTSTDDLVLLSGLTEKMRIQNNGDISFYEDTGSTAKLVWRAADESLEIGGVETTDNYPLIIKSDSSHHAIHIEENSGGEGYTLGVDADGDLGFYNSGAATASVTFDDSNNVGIGTDSPSAPLHLVGSALVGVNDFGAYDKDDANLLISNGNNGTSILLHDGSGAYHSGLVKYDTNVMSLGLNNSNDTNSILTSTALNITSTGVGIGNTNPDAIIRADSGTANKTLFKHNPPSNRYFSIAESSDGTYDNAITTFYKDATVGQFVFETAAAERMRITSSGNVGIGTSAINGKLDIANSDQTNGVTLSLTNTFVGSDWNSGDVIGEIDFRTDDSSTSEPVRGRIKVFDDNTSGGTYSAYNAMSFSTGSVNALYERMRIDSSGRVGIGTLSPSSSLGAGGLHVTDRIAVGSGSAGTPALHYDGDTDTGLFFGTGVVAVSTGGTEAMRITSAGNVGIGTDSPTNFTNGTVVEAAGGTNTGAFLASSNNGTVVAEVQGNNADGLTYFGSRTNHPVVFRQNGLEAMRIDSSGNVGIGTGSPSELISAEGVVGANADAPYLALSAGRPTDRYSAIGLNRGSTSNQVGLSFYTTNNLDTPTEKMRIDSSGNVGIGTSSPAISSKLNVESTTKAIDSGGTIFASVTDAMAADIGGQVMMGGYYTGTTTAAFGGFAAKKENATNGNYAGYLQFMTSSHGAGNTEKMRIDSSGNLLVGGTSVGADETFAVSSSGSAVISRTSGSARYMIDFDNGGSNVGRITTSTTSTTYGTSSDYRLKENVVELTGATDRLKQLNPSRFNFIADADTTVDGFIAHEVQTVVPEAITGTHNEVDADGNPVHQGIDQSKLVPLLVATIKELEARITALENA